MGNLVLHLDKSDRNLQYNYFSITRTSLKSSVTRLGDLLDFGQVLKPLATINLPKSPTFLGIK